MNCHKVGVNQKYSTGGTAPVSRNFCCGRKLANLRFPLCVKNTLPMIANSFNFAEAHVGYINGFARRMWQGNETHRGRKGRPGRVATLIPKSNKRTFGKAFVLKSKEQVRDRIFYHGVHFSFRIHHPYMLELLCLAVSYLIFLK